jgi:hypothetical protein
MQDSFELRRYSKVTKPMKLSIDKGFVPRDIFGKKGLQ